MPHTGIVRPPGVSRDRISSRRAAILLSRWALDVIGLERLELFAHPENVASQRVAEKAGFHREGIARSVPRHAGIPRRPRTVLPRENRPALSGRLQQACAERGRRHELPFQQ